MILLPSHIDDDYCDCADGSDERRTGACSGVTTARTFVCLRDASEHGPVSIAPSRVHDGVCDCCDGSDEAGLQCPDRCASLDAEVAAREASRLRGVRMRDELAQHAARSRAAAHGAPHPAFGALAGKCFHDRTDEYLYEVCLYNKATQGKHGTATSLGRSWAWRSGPHGTNPLGVLTGGDHCHGANVARSLQIRFECSADGDALGHVSERSPCVYEVALKTAAAC